MAACTVRKGCRRAFEYLMMEEHGADIISRLCLPSHTVRFFDKRRYKLIIVPNTCREKILNFKVFCGTNLGF